jgi:hypothetical protein
MRALPEQDSRFLEEKGIEFEAAVDSGMLCVTLKRFRLPDGYEPRDVDLLLRLPAGYPDASPDMFWIQPAVRLLKTGSYPAAADQMEHHLGRTWQRFSRHLAPGVWRPGADTLQAYLALIATDLARSA